MNRRKFLASPTVAVAIKVLPGIASGIAFAKVDEEHEIYLFNFLEGRYAPLKEVNGKWFKQEVNGTWIEVF